MLVGGASTRYGSDKATLFGPIVVDALRAAGADPVLRIGGTDGDIADADGEGPMAGVRAALAASPIDVVMVLACDLPDASPDVIRAVVSALAGAPSALVAVPVVEGRREPLHAAWRTSALLHIDPAEKAVHKVLASLDVVDVPDLDPRAFRNVNRPGD